MPSERLVIRVLSVLSLGFVSSLACAPLEGRSYDLRSKSYEVPVQGAEALAWKDRSYVVPPDRALLRVAVHGVGQTIGESRQELRQQIDAVKSAARKGGCAATIDDYTSPWDGGGTRWGGRAELRVEVDLREAEDVDARIGAVEACLGALADARTPREGRDQPVPDVSSVVYDVFDPDVHAGMLWSRHVESMARVTADAGERHREELRCSSPGSVTVEARAISGVVLSLDMDCRVAGSALPTGVLATGTGAVGPGGVR